MLRPVNTLLRLALIAVFPGLTAPAVAAAEGRSPVYDALIKLSVDRIDTVTGYMAESARVLGRQYAFAYKRVPALSEAERAAWQAGSRKRDDMVTFQTWTGDPDSPPSYQSPHPAFHDYRAGGPTEETYRQLKVFERLVPAFVAEYETFGFSWVYLTTADEVLMIYPFLPPINALENAPPTKQVFYTSADFANRRCGWSPPYLDLVGAGMMVTVACPVYEGDTVLGVMSRDITLRQLSASVLAHLAVEPGAVAYIVDENGLLLGTSAPVLASELDRVNNDAGAAVLYFRMEKGLGKLARAGAVVSSSVTMNALTEAVLERAKASAGDIVGFEMEDNEVLAARTAGTGWYVVLAFPEGLKGTGS